MKNALLFFALLFFGILATHAGSLEMVSNLTASKTQSDRVTMRWDAVAGAKKYIVWLGDADGKKLRRIIITKTHKTIKKLSAGTEYQIKVRAKAKSEYGAWSDMVSVTTASETPQPETQDVTIDNFAFSPQSITIHAGDTVRWTDKDSMSHTVTSDDGAFQSSGSLNNTTYEVTFDTAGTYSYYCTPHSFMTGTIVVE